MYQLSAPGNPAFELERLFPVNTPVIAIPDSLSAEAKESAEIAAIISLLVLIVVAALTVFYGGMEIAGFLAELNQNPFFESISGAEGFYE